MTRIPLKVKKLRADVILPEYGSEFSAGADIRACLDEKVIIKPGKTAFIPTGLSIEIPEGYVGLMFARSGTASKRGLAPANKVGVIDSDYRGEVMVALHNHGDTAQIVDQGERISQLVIIPYLHCEFIESDELSDTERGKGGFGSTGIK